MNDLAAWMASRGHDVTVLTGFPNYPGGRLYPGYRGWRLQREVWNGVQVVRVPLLPRGDGRGWRLAVNYLSFALSASVLGPWRLGRRFDAIFVHEPSPMTVGIPAVVMGKWSGAPIHFWVLDLWPESVAAAGGVRSRWVLGALTRMTKWIYRHCRTVLVQSRAFIPRVRAMGVAEDRIRYFPNWAEAGYRRGEGAGPPVSLPAGFRIMYAGNIGAAQDFPAVLKAAELARDRSDLQWILIGDGREAGWVREEIARRGLDSVVHMLGSHSPEHMPGFFAQADAMLVSLKTDPVFALTVPAKVQAYLACGRPILAMLDGEGANIVTEAGAGLAVPSGNASGLASAARHVAGLSPAEREQMGRRARDYSQTHFNRDRLFEQLETWLSEDDHGKDAAGR